MKGSNPLVIIIILLFLAGCAHSPPDDEIWYKPGADRIEIRKALLECGLSSSLEYRYVDICMLISGFRHKSEHALLFREYPIDLCNPPHSERPSICDTVPNRNIKRRLDSYYCNNNSMTFCRILDGMNGYDCTRKEYDSVPEECWP